MKAVDARIMSQTGRIGQLQQSVKALPCRGSEVVDCETFGERSLTQGSSGNLVIPVWKWRQVKLADHVADVCKGKLQLARYERRAW